MATLRKSSVMTQEPGRDGQEIKAQQPASRTSQQPWENVIGTSPEGLIISYRVAQQATQQTQDPRSGGWARKPGAWLSSSQRGRLVEGLG